jgi:hypothetical protein
MNNLHPIAQSVQSQGRGEDTQLVHMTPGEVQGLQALAKAHGGSLTINPETGLVEAGFLKSILPTVAGVGLSMMGVPPPLAAGIVGLGTTALNGGDLGKGLMAGIGAYGGAGLGQSLFGASSGLVSGAPAVNSSIQAANTGLATQGASGLGTSAAQSASANNFLTQSGMTGLPQASLAPQGLGAIPQTVTPMATSAMSKLATPGFYGDNALNIGAAISPMLFQEPETQSAPVDNEQYQYTYNPGKTSREDLDAQRLANPGGELRYFTPSYQGPNKVRVAQGGILGLAEGGMPEEYTFDPVTQKYTKKPGVAPTAPMAAVKPIGIDSSGGYESTVSAPNSGYSGPGLMSMALGNFGQAPAPVDSSEQTFTPAAAQQAQQAASIASIGGSGGNSGFDTSGGGGSGMGAPGAGTAAGAASGNSEGSGGAADGSDTAGGYNRGGIMGLAKGGMARGGFVVPADVVSALGNGSTDAGLRSLKAKFGAVKHIKGKGDGLSDSIPTSIDGRQPARVADGEAYIDPKTVASIGKGDPKKGAQKLYAMMDKIRGQAHGKTTQQRKVDPRKVV